MESSITIRTTNLFYANTASAVPVSQKAQEALSRIKGDHRLQLPDHAKYPGAYRVLNGEQFDLHDCAEVSKWLEGEGLRPTQVCPVLKKLQSIREGFVAVLDLRPNPSTDDRGWTNELGAMLREAHAIGLVSHVVISSKTPAKLGFDLKDALPPSEFERGCISGVTLTDDGSTENGTTCVDLKTLTQAIAHCPFVKVVRCKSSQWLKYLPVPPKVSLIEIAKDLTGNDKAELQSHLSNLPNRSPVTVTHESRTEDSFKEFIEAMENTISSYPNGHNCIQQITWNGPGTIPSDVTNSLFKKYGVTLQHSPHTERLEANHTAALNAAKDFISRLPDNITLGQIAVRIFDCLRPTAITCGELRDLKRHLANVLAVRIAARRGEIGKGAGAMPAPEEYISDTIAQKIGHGTLDTGLKNLDLLWENPDNDSALAWGIEAEISKTLEPELFRLGKLLPSPNRFLDDDILPKRELLKLAKTGIDAIDMKDSRRGRAAKIQAARANLGSVTLSPTELQSITSSLMENIGKTVYAAFDQSKKVMPWPDGKPPRIGQSVFTALKKFRYWGLEPTGDYDLSVSGMARKLAECANAGIIKATADEVVAYLQIMVYDEIRDAMTPKK